MQDILDATVEQGKLPGITAAVIVADVRRLVRSRGDRGPSTDLLPESQLDG